MRTASRLGLALLTALSTPSITGDELQFHATPGAELCATLERTYEWTMQSIAVSWRDQEMDLSSFYPSLTLRGEHEARWCDTWEAVEDGEPVAYRRTIHALGNRLEWEWTLGAFGTELVRTPMTGAAIDADLRARRCEDGWSFEVLGPSWLEEADCAGLAGAVGWRGVLPGAPVTEGTRWYPAGPGLHELLRPLGRPRMELEFGGTYSGQFALLSRMLDPGELLELGDERVAVRYLSTEDGVAELELALDSEERLEMAERAREDARTLDIDKETRHLLERATVDVDLDGRGRLLWSTEESRPISAELEGTIEVDVTLVIGEPWDMRIRVEFDGEFREDLAFVHTPADGDGPTTSDRDTQSRSREPGR